MRRIALTALLALVCTGCASIDFYTNEAAKGDTVGLRVYTKKPFILVSYLRNKDNPVKIEVISLPDLSSPRYVRFKPGILGNSKLNIALADGSISSLGLETTSEVSTLLTAYGSLANAVANATKATAESESIRAATSRAGGPALQSATKPEIEGKLSTLATDLRGLKTKADANLMPSESSGIEPLASQIDSARVAYHATTGTPEALHTALAAAVKKWRETFRGPAEVSTDGPKAVLEDLKSLQTRLVAIATDLEEPPEAGPDFTLFEILDNRGQPFLRAVENETLLQLAMSKVSP